MNNLEKQQQADNFTISLNGITTKMEQNETDMANSQPMTTPPYILRQDITLLNRNISLFIATEFPDLTKDQHEALPTTNNEQEYAIAGTSISSVDAATLNYLRFELEQVLKQTIERFNQHLINLRPHSYQNIPQPIIF